MRRNITSIAILATVGILLLSLSNCGRDQELVGIQVQPGAETVGATDIPVSADAGFQVQLSAVGSYIHPPVTKDITNQVTWASNTPQMFTVDSTGLLTTTGGACGSTLVSATVTTNKSTGGISSSGAVVVGYMTASVICFTGSGTGAGPAITITFAGTGSGTVSSSPAGWSCTGPNPCVDSFPAGTVLTLTATPTAPATTGSWGETCPTTTITNVCTFTVEENTTLTVSFS
jgi:hypothetical protein